MKVKFNKMRAIFIIVMGLMPFFAVAQTTLSVVYSDNTQVEYTIQSSGKLYFSGNNLMILTASSVTVRSIAVADIKKIVFEQSTNKIEETPDAISRFMIYPNPADDILSFTHANTTEVFAVSIFDVQGREVLNGRYSSGEKINISHIKSGTYFVRFNNLETIKLIKK